MKTSAPLDWVDTETREYGEKRLMHSNGAERFYRELKRNGVQARVGIEATGRSRWFERLLAEPGFKLWVGDAAEIRAARVRKQRNDRFDARYILKLLMEAISSIINSRNYLFPSFVQRHP